MEYHLSEQENLIIALLFALPGAVDPEDIAKVLSLSAEEAAENIELLSGRMKAMDGALLIRNVGDKYELCANDKYTDTLKTLIENSREAALSDTMLETLAIIIERGQATRVDIEEVRGVKSDFAVNRLVEYGLIEECGRLNLPGRPMVFRPTDECMRHFGLGKADEIEDLVREERGDGEDSRL